jgi:hypothetical protein
MSLIQHVLYNQVAYALALNSILAFPQIERFYKPVAPPSMAHPICPRPLANDTGLYVSPEDIAVILRQPVPKITVTQSTRVALAPFTAWSETTTATKTTMATTVIASTTFTETRTQFLRKPIVETQWLPSGTSTAVEYRTLWRAEYITEYLTPTVIPEPTQGPGTQDAAGYFDSMPSGELGEMLLAFLVFALIGLGFCLAVLRYRPVLRVWNNAFNELRAELRDREKEVARINEEHQRKAANQDEAMSTMQQIVKDFCGSEVEDAYLHEGIDHEEVLRKWRAFRKATEKEMATKETQELHWKYEEAQDTIVSLRGRYQQLEKQIHLLAEEADLKYGFERLVYELSSDLNMAEEKLRHLER